MEEGLDRGVLAADIVDCLDLAVGGEGLAVDARFRLGVETGVVRVLTGDVVVEADFAC